MITDKSSFYDYGTLVLRVALGAMWISHALLKYVVFTIPGFAGFLASKSLPAFVAWPVFMFELLGGAAIVLGVRGRYVSLTLLPVMLVAAWTHAPNGWLFTNAGGGWEYPVFLAAASVVHFLIGDGVYALVRERRGDTRAVAALSRST